MSIGLQRLRATSLDRLPASVTRPSYDRAAVTAGVVHFGVGAFHRAHQAAVIDSCLAAGDPNWGIVGASLRSADTRDALAPQDGLYTLSVRDGAGETLRVIGALGQVLVAPENPEALLDRMGAPAVRLVTLTVSEKAYLRAAGGGLDTAHPLIAADLAAPSRPRSVHGFLAEALHRRKARGTPPFTILCCDNLPANGTTLQRLLLEFARLRDGALADHIESAVAFPSSMVDRIVPATTDADRARIAGALGLEDRWPVTTEPFLQWVIEEDFRTGRPDWEPHGVTMVPDVRPFEEMKLRLLNGAHSAIAYLGLLGGHATVAEAFGDPAIRAFVHALWAESRPTLPSELDTASYVEALTKRFDNPALKHRTAQIATDGSQKLPQRIVAPALARAGQGGTRHLAAVVAAWIAACEARGRALDANAFSDPLDPELSAIAARRLPAQDAVLAVFDAAGFAIGAASRAALAGEAARTLETLRAGDLAAVLRMGERP